MGVLKIDDLHPDGVPVFVDWDAVRVGTSFFVPCINTSAAIKQVKGVFGRRGWTMRIHITAERNILGVRFWRTA